MYIEYNQFLAGDNVMSVRWYLDLTGPCRSYREVLNLFGANREVSKELITSISTLEPQNQYSALPDPLSTAESDPKYHIWSIPVSPGNSTLPSKVYSSKIHFLLIELTWFTIVLILLLQVYKVIIPPLPPMSQYQLQTFSWPHSLVYHKHSTHHINFTR